MVIDLQACHSPGLTRRLLGEGQAASRLRVTGCGVYQNELLRGVKEAHRGPGSSQEVSVPDLDIRGQPADKDFLVVSEAGASVCGEAVEHADGVADEGVTVDAGQGVGELAH